MLQGVQAWWRHHQTVKYAGPRPGASLAVVQATASHGGLY
jgi:hypothetical protein